MFVLAGLAATAVLCADPSPPAVAAPSTVLPAETAAQRAVRHAAVAKAREGTILLAHRGAATLAPENTIAAIEEAFRLGCEAVKLDFRRTLDGVIVLYHDDRLEHRLNMFGTIEISYYAELRLASLRDGIIHGQFASIPTLDEVLEVLRRNNGLVFIDVKTPEISHAILTAFRKADMLDHIIGYGTANAEAFQLAGIPQIAFKGSLLGTHKDLDAECVRQLLARPGQVVFLDDPRAAITLLARPVQPVAQFAMDDWRIPPYLTNLIKPKLAAEQAVLEGRAAEIPVRVAAAQMARQNGDLLVRMLPQLVRSRRAEVRRALAWNLAMNPFLVSWYGRAREHYEPVFLNLLASPDLTVSGEAAIACASAHVKGAGREIVRLLGATFPIVPASQEERQAVIEVRGYYAFALGLLGQNKPAEVEMLLKIFREREKGKNGLWLGDDGAMAAWALGRLRAAEAVPLFREVLLWRPPPGVEAADDDEPPRAYVYWDMQAPRFLPQALVQIGTPAAFDVLDEVLRLPAAEVNRGSAELMLDTADALSDVATEKRPARLARLFAHGSSEARGAATLRCLRESGTEYRQLLETHAAWAVSWWDREHRGQEEGAKR